MFCALAYNIYAGPRCCCAIPNSPCSVKEFGAFVELDKYTKNGLIHISEIASYRLEPSDIEKHLQVGQHVYCKVVKVELVRSMRGERARVCLSACTDQQDPTGQMRIGLSVKNISQKSGRPVRVQ